MSQFPDTPQVDTLDNDNVGWTPGKVFTLISLCQSEPVSHITADDNNSGYRSRRHSTKTQLFACFAKGCFKFAQFRGNRSGDSSRALTIPMHMDVSFSLFDFACLVLWGAVMWLTVSNRHGKIGPNVSEGI